jgi:hypothetical protein
VAGEMKFEIKTWGSCVRKYLDMLYPIKLPLSTITGKSGIVETEWFTINVDNRDSSKNMKREIAFVSIKQPIIMRYHGSLSCSQSFDIVYLVDEKLNFVELEIKKEVKTETDAKFTAVKEIYYVVNPINNKYIVLDEKVVKRQKRFYEVKILVSQDGTTMVLGETFEIRDVLKNLKLKWDPTRKAWVGKTPVEVVRQRLEQIPDVVILT